MDCFTNSFMIAVHISSIDVAVSKFKCNLHTLNARASAQAPSPEPYSRYGPNLRSCLVHISNIYSLQLKVSIFLCLHLTALSLPKKIYGLLLLPANCGKIFIFHCKDYSLKGVNQSRTVVCKDKSFYFNRLFFHPFNPC